ncbi:uncharacterized protein LOC108917608 [Anoplophora glabripennis]|uniref:uncharacterized protein LOC108917608 n=1 Tax=Anoplophora glabripennis TaxID=217634 RepID=UPI000874B9FF|nr:uncharacterized protein LOC108917608 [Anoplophora glabripennis]
MKKVTFSLPIKFDILKFVYQYHSIMWSLTAKGEVQANLKNMKAKIIISFDFEKCVVSLDQFNITDQGQLSVSFSGRGFLDWIFSLCSTSSMHFSMIQDIRNTVSEELEKIVAKINSALKFILQE